VLKVVRIRQRDCKSRPQGSGSSPPAPTRRNANRKKETGKIRVSWRKPQ